MAFSLKLVCAEIVRRSRFRRKKLSVPPGRSAGPSSLMEVDERRRCYQNCALLPLRPPYSVDGILVNPVAIERDQAQIGAVTARATARFYSGGVSENVQISDREDSTSPLSVGSGGSSMTYETGSRAELGGKGDSGGTLSTIYQPQTYKRPQTIHQGGAKLSTTCLLYMSRRTALSGPAPHDLKLLARRTLGPSLLH